MNPDYKLKLVVGYLESPDLASEWSSSTPISVEALLSWTCRTLSEPRAGALAGRYRTIEKIDEQLLGFPWEPVLLEKVLIPIQQAKVAFVMGHELGCIALCGMVGEMLAVFRFEISKVANESSFREGASKHRRKWRKFEEQGQTVRMALLELLDLIDSETHDKFSKLAKTRNKWLHRLSETHESLAADAIESYRLACELAVAILRTGGNGERFNLNPDVLAYLKAMNQKL